MKLTGPACTEAMNEAEEAGTRERTGDNAGGVRVERRVRRDGKTLGSLHYECIPLKNRRNRAAMDTTESAIAGIRKSFLRACMTPVKSRSATTIAT